MQTQFYTIRPGIAMDMPLLPIMTYMNRLASSSELVLKKSRYVQFWVRGAISHGEEWKTTLFWIVFAAMAVHSAWTFAVFVRRLYGKFVIWLLPDGVSAGSDNSKVD